MFWQPHLPLDTFWYDADAHVSVKLLVSWNSLDASVQAFEAEQSFLIHHANAFEDGEDIEVWSSGWGPEALKRLASGAGMLGSWKVVLEGDFTGIPFTALWKHR